MSFITRLYQLNFYAAPYTITSLCLKNQTQTDNFAQPRTRKTYQALQDLLGIDAYQLYQATPHRFAGVVMSPLEKKYHLTLPDGKDVQILPSRYPKCVYAQKNAQYCPYCLQEEAYHRLPWMFSPSTVCLRHLCLLTKKCPNCWHQVTIRAITERRCKQCRYDLSQGITPSVANDELGLLTQQIIQSWWRGDPTTQIETGLPQQPITALFQVVENLGNHFKDFGKNWSYMHTVTNQELAISDEVYGRHTEDLERYSWYTTACKILLDWPHGFHEFLEAYRQRKLQANNKLSIPKNLGTIYTQYLSMKWKHPLFDFVQEAANQYLMDTYRGSGTLSRLPRFRDNPNYQQPYLALSTASRKLSVMPDKMVSLATEYQLVDYKVPEHPFPDHRRNLLIKGDDVIALKQKWEEAVPSEWAAKILGISGKFVRDLLAYGLLTQVRGPEVDGNKGWYTDYDSLETFVTNLRQVTSDKPRGKIHFIIRAIRVLSLYDFSFASLIDQILQEKIKAHWRSEDMLLMNLQVSRADVEKLLAELQAENSPDTNRQIASRRNAKKWKQAEGDSASKQVQMSFNFSSEPTEVDDTGLVSTPKACEIMKLRPSLVQRWVQAGRLRPVLDTGSNERHHYLFRQEDVERLRPENRLTTPQMAEHLGISCYILGTWIKQGKVKPVSGPGIDNAYQYLFLLDDYLPDNLV